MNSFSPNGGMNQSGGFNPNASMNLSSNYSVKKKKIKPATAIIMIIIILIIVGVMNPKLLFFLNEKQQSAVQLFKDTYLTPYIGGIDGGIDIMKFVALALLIVGAWVLNKLVQIILSRINFKSRDAKTIQGLISNIAKYAIVISTAVTGLAMLGVNMGAIIASLGILSLIIGFGAQSLIEDVITGIFILLEGQYHVGDIIAVGDFRGRVINIGIRTTSIMDDGGDVKIVNNSDIREMVNLSDEGSYAYITLPISFEEDLEKAEKTVYSVLDSMPEKYPKFFKNKPQYFGVEEIAPDCLTLMIAGIVDEGVIYDARRALYRELKIAMDRDGIKHPTGDTASVEIVGEE